MWNIEFESPENIPKFKGKHYLTSKFRVEFFSFLKVMKSINITFLFWKQNVIEIV